MISVRHLTKSFAGRLAVEDVSFEIEAGQVLGLLGPNGAGKTTVLRMLAGFFPPTGGDVVLNGLDVVEEPEAAKRILGYLPEACPLYPELRVNEQLRYRAALYGLSRRQRRDRVREVGRACGLTGTGRRITGHLSKGYRQRVGLAAALVHDPSVLLLDEPTIGLDPLQRGEVRDLIRSLAGDRTVVVSTHLLDEAEAICDRVVILHEGRVAGAGTPADLARAANRQRQVIVDVRLRSGLLDRIRSVPGVAGITESPLEEDWVRLHLTLASGDDVRETLWQCLAGAGAAVREFREAAPTLESLFVNLTRGDGV